MPCHQALHSAVGERHPHSSLLAPQGNETGGERSCCAVPCRLLVGSSMTQLYGAIRLHVIYIYRPIPILSALESEISDSKRHIFQLKRAHGHFS